MNKLFKISLVIIVLILGVSLIDSGIYIINYFFSSERVVDQLFTNRLIVLLSFLVFGLGEYIFIKLGFIKYEENFL